MPSPIARYLRAAPPAPNAARTVGLKAPQLLRNKQGWVEWYGTLEKFSGDVVALGAPEMAQGFGRLLAAAVAAVGAPPGFEPLLALLEHGDEASVEFAATWVVSALKPTLGDAWVYHTNPRRPDPAPGADPLTADINPAGEGRIAGLNLIFAARDAVEAVLKRSSKRPNPFGNSSVSRVLSYGVSVLMDCRPELSSAEVLAQVHLLLDPAARHPAPGGLWVETSRQGRRVRAVYGRGGASLVAAEYELRVRGGLPPSYEHEVTKFVDLAAARGGRSEVEDAVAALADLVRRGVVATSFRVLYDAPQVRGALERAGFAVGSFQEATIAPEAARALELAFPRPTG